MEQELLLGIRATDEKAEHILWLMRVGGMEDMPTEFMDEVYKLVTWMVIKTLRGDMIGAFAPDMSGFTQATSKYLTTVALNKGRVSLPVKLKTECDS